MNRTNLLLVIIFLSAAFFCAATDVASAIWLDDKYVGNTVVDLEWPEWSERPDGFSKYELCRDDDLIHTEFNRETTFYRDEGLTKGNEYNYEIKVYNASGGLVDGDKETVTAGEVHGTITQSTTWTLATSPYGLTGAVIVDECARLTIENGLTVNGDKCGIRVGGTISPLDSVTFNGAGILLINIGGSSIKNCVFNGGGIHLHCCNGGIISDTTVKSSGGTCIAIERSHNCKLTHNTVWNSSHRGIELVFSNHSDISNNKCLYNAAGIRVWESNNNSISSNTCSNNVKKGEKAGIYILDSNYNSISNNDCLHNGYDGITLFGSNNNNLTNNNVDSNNDYGIYLTGSSKNNTFTSNTVNNNSDDGIKLSGSDNNMLTSNTANNNSGDGIDMYSSRNNTLTDNTVTGNFAKYDVYPHYGIKLDGASNNNTIYNNYFNNTHNAYDDGNNIWNITKTPGENIVGGPYLGGNYWSDYAGVDIDGDGLGDTSLPYNCSEQIAHGGDYRPLTVSLALRASTHYHLPYTYVLLYTEIENVTGYEQCSCSNIYAYVVVNDKITYALPMKNDGAGLGSRDHPDFIADDCHFSLWLLPESIEKAEKYVLDLYVTEKPFFEKESAHKVDTIELERKSDPKLLVLTDFRELFKEFDRTARGSSSADKNQNCIRDYYEAVDRLQEYATAHNGTVVDVRKDAYKSDHDYYWGGIFREPMWKDIDTMICRLPDTMKNKIKYIAIIGDDAVVPFYRVDVLSGCTDEANYVHNEIGTGPKGQKKYKGSNPTLIDIANLGDYHMGHWMSDIAYGTFGDSCLLDVGLGRVFRDKPLELVQLIDAFEQPLDLRRGQSRTFILNPWNEREDKKFQFHEMAMDTLVPPVKRHYGGITRENTLPRNFVGNYPAGGHWVTGENLNWDEWDIWRGVKGQTDLLVLLSHGVHWKHQDGHCRWITVETLSNRRGDPATYRLLVIGGCHCGLNIARHDGYMWNQMLCRQALSVNSAFFGTTSYDTGPVSGNYDYYHERMRRLFLERLFSPTTHTLGDVLQQAHGDYYRSCWGLNDNDRKVLATVELYGLPTQPVITRRAAQAQGTGLKALPIQSTKMMSDGFKQLIAKNQSSNRTVVISHFEVVEDEQGRVLFAVPYNGRLGGVEFAPILPMVHHSYLLPYDATNVSVVLTSNQSHFYEQTVGMVLLIPVSKSFGPLNSTANITNPYPKSILNYSTSLDIGGLRLDVLLVPLQYNPDTGQVTLYDRLDYQVSYTATTNVTVNKIEVNDGNPVNIDLTDVPINVTISAAESLNGALLWEIRDAAGNLVDIDYGTIEIKEGTSQVSLSVNTVGWEPGPKQFMVQLYDAYSENETGRVVASGQKCFTAIGTSLEVSTKDSIYGSSNTSATVIAVVRNETGAKVSGLANNFTQKLGGNETTLVWSEDADGYTTSLELTDIASGQHNLSVFVNGCAAETLFLVDRNPPTSTASSPAEVYTSAFKVRISGDDNVSAVDEYYVQYRVGENGTWTDWLMRIGGFDYSHTDQDNLEPIFGPTEPINVTEGTTYCFRVNAVDYAGNLEEIHTEADTCTTYVAEAKVVINEVYPNPVADGGEWIEFYNDGEVDLNLTGWRIVNGDDELDYSIPANSSDWDGILESDSYLVLHLGGTLDTPAEDLCAGIAYGVLGNEDDSVSLLSDDNIGVDFVRYGNWTDDPPTGTSWTGVNPDAPVQGQSLGRDKDSTDMDDGSDWENTCGIDVDGPTPGLRNFGEGQLPKITSYAPESPVNDTVCNWRTFNVTVNQTVNVSWYLNESLLFTNKSVTEAGCRLHAEVAGEHNVSAIATNANGTDMQMWIWNVTAAPPEPPNISFFAPPSPVNDTVCNWRTFNVTVNQTVNVSWYLNDSPLFTNESVTEANCTLHAEVAGEHNVSAIATNPNGTDMQMWIWNVTVAPAPAPPNITSFAPPSPVNDVEGATRIFNIKIDQPVNISWQINGTEVQTNTSVTEASYTNTSAAIGTWNVFAIATKANGTDMQTWIWTVEASSPCYIATATYGTPLDENIDVLRDFRDEVLMTNPVGEAFVSTYYATSPPIADALRENEGLRTITRLTLITPLVYLSKFALNGILVVFIVGLTVVPLYLRRDRKKILKSLLVGMGSILVLIAAIFSLGFAGYAIPFCAVVGAYMLPFVIPLSVVFTLCTVLKLHMNVSHNIKTLI